MKQLSKWSLRIIGPVIFLLLLFFKIDIKETISFLSQTNLLYVAVATFLIFPLTMLLRAYKWWRLLKLYGIECSYSKALYLYYLGLSANIILPASLGSFSKAAFLKKDGYPLGTSFITIFFDKITELTAIVIILGLSYFGLPEVLLPFTRKIFLGIGIIIVLALVFRKPLQKLWGKTYARMKGKEGVGVDSSNNNSPGNNLSIWEFLKLSILGIGVKMGDYSLIYLCALSLQIHMKFLDLLICSNIFALLSHIPITVSGIGIRDATFVFLFPLFGSNVTSAASLSILLFLLTTLLQLGGFLLLVKYPKRKKVDS